MNKITILAILITVSISSAFKAPQHKTLRALSMGNAFTAVAEDRNAIYTNPAGLNLLNKLGNYDKRPDLGYYPDNWYDMRMDLGLSLPDMTGLFQSSSRFYDDHGQTISKLGTDRTTALKNDSTLYNDAAFIDRLPISLGTILNLELAMHNFGGAIWTDITTQPFIDMGIILPSAGIQSVDANLVAQVAGALEITPYLNVGAGYKVMYTNHIGLKEIDASLLGSSSQLDSIASATLDEQVTQFNNDVKNIAVSHGFDLGAQYQFSRTMRAGVALLDIFPAGIRDQSVTPELNVGVVLSPRKFQRNTAFARKVNFAFDLNDLLNDDKNYKFASKINFGAEWEQVWLAIPSIKLGSNARAIATRLAAGFKGGYWTLGTELELMRVLHLNLATWADEQGYFTGQEPERKFIMSFGLGF